MADDAPRRRAIRHGGWAEGVAAARLILAGWIILGRRVTAGRGNGMGEIDIVARRRATVAFVEVKFRPSLAEAAAAIQPRQRGRIERAARHFLASHPDLADCDARFDAVLVAPWRWPRHLADAWRAEG